MAILQTNTPDMESQAKKRRGQRLLDQHGRPYFANIELKTGDPVGVIEPLFQAPLMPPLAYLKKSPDLNRPNDLIIDYRRWLEDNQEARNTREQKGREISRKMFNTAYDPDKPFSLTVLDMIGPEPDPIEPIIAASQGNRWILGLSTKDTHNLARFIKPKQDPKAIDFARYDFRDDEPAADEWDLEEDARGALDARTPRHAAHLGAADSQELEDDDLDDEFDDDDAIDESEESLRAGQLEGLEELEEEIDPDALGGKRVAVPSQRRRRRGSRPRTAAPAPDAG